MGDITKLPRWAQDHIRQLGYRAERAEKKAERLNTECENWSGKYQELVDILLKLADKGIPEAMAFRVSYQGE
jgi:hypothetical protein